MNLLEYNQSKKYKMIVYSSQIAVPTSHSFEVIDITEQIDDLVSQSGVLQGMVSISSMHTTCAVAVNENEIRLFDDIQKFFLSIAPPDEPYKHNDLHLREDIPPDEPENAHSHLIAMMLGNSEVVTVTDGALLLGRYQSILVLEMDGPRQRNLAIQVMGSR
ncbi:MAG: secondary thiamine-phosphate synthase enzyme YjbQ [Candidatus Thiodiazotropha sp.]